MVINQAQTENVENENAEFAYWVEMRESLDRLKENKDFKKVILDGYFKDKAINGVSLLATDYVRNAGKRPEIMEALVAISQLEDYFSTIDAMGTIPTEDELAAEAAAEEE